MSENLLKAQNFLARSTIKSYEDGQLFLNYDQLIHAVNKDSIFLEQLIVANPKIYINLLRYNNGQLKKKRQRKLFESLYKYYKRSYLRSTPFGLFSESFIGDYGGINQYSFQGAARKNVILDSQWLLKLVYQMEVEFQNELSYILNNANYEFGDRVFELYSVNSTDIEELNIKLTNVYKIIASECKGKFTHYEELYESVINTYGKDYTVLTEQYLSNLIKNHYLLSNLQQDILDDFDWDIFLSRIKNVDRENKYFEKLTEIRKLIEEYSDLKIGDGVEKLSKLYERMSQIIENDNYIQVDLYNNSKIHISPSQKISLEKTANFLSNTVKSVERTYLDDYKGKFIEKYGVDQEVQLTEMFDSTFGIGAPFDYTHPKNDFIESEPTVSYYSDEEKEMYLSKYIAAVEDNEDINLTDLTDYYKKKYFKDGEEINGIELFFNMINENKYSFMLSNIVGNSNLGGASGRFSHLSTEISEYHSSLIDIVEQENKEKNVTSCEIVFLPENIRHTNVMHTSINRDKVLPIFATTSHSNVELRNIFIGIDGNEKFYAKDIATNEFVKFYVTNMYNRSLFSNELRFLCDISSNNKFGNLPWSILYDRFTYVPRIVFDDIIISPAKWRFNNKDLEQGVSIEKLLENSKVPKEFYITSADNKVYFSKESSLDMKLLTSEVRKIVKRDGFIELQEYIEEKETVEKDGKARITDIVVPFARQVKVFEKFETPNRNRRTSIDYREKLPFEEWLYLKLQIPNNRQNEFLTSYLPEIQKRIKELDGELFFLRYIDPKPEIRIRIKCKDLFKAYNNILDILILSRENRVLYNFDIATYDKEIERYGGKELINLSEKVFCRDSDTIPSLLLESKNNNDLMLEDIAIVVDYLYLKHFFNNDVDKIISFLNVVGPKNIDGNTNEKTKYYQKIVTNKLLMSQFIIDNNINNLEKAVNELVAAINVKDISVHKRFSIIDSIIHVHNNRLIGIDRNKEKDIYYILNRIITAEKYIKKQGKL